MTMRDPTTMIDAVMTHARTAAAAVGIAGSLVGAYVAAGLPIPATQAFVRAEVTGVAVKIDAWRSPSWNSSAPPSSTPGRGSGRNSPPIGRCGGRPMPARASRSITPHGGDRRRTSAPRARGQDQDLVTRIAKMRSG